MKSCRLAPVLVVAALAALAAAAVAPRAAADSELATQRKVHGVITAIDATTLTIATEKATITGKLDASRTRVLVNGRPAKPSELQVTARAKAELCLDDVWTLVAAH